MIEIYWNDLKKEKQDEILAALGENGNYDMFPLVQIPTPEDELNAEETVWITVYKDTLGHPQDFDNLTEIKVPQQWLKQTLEAEGVSDYSEWENEYTADNTEDIARLALEEGVILDCSDKSIAINLAERQRDAEKKPSLENQIDSAASRISKPQLNQDIKKEIEPEY